MATTTQFTSVVDAGWKLRLSACRFIAEVLVEPCFLLVLDGSSSHELGGLGLGGRGSIRILGLSFNFILDFFDFLSFFSFLYFL